MLRSVVASLVLLSSAVFTQKDVGLLEYGLSHTRHSDLFIERQRLSLSYLEHRAATLPRVKNGIVSFGVGWVGGFAF